MCLKLQGPKVPKTSPTNASSVSAAVERILTCDQWIWLRDVNAPSESIAMQRAIRRAVHHFARLFGALTGADPDGAQQMVNQTRAKVLLGAIMYSISDTPPQSVVDKQDSWYSHARCAGKWSQNSAVNCQALDLARSFYALCVAPRSTNRQRIFLRQHILVTLTLIQNGIEPGALAKDWTSYHPRMKTQCPCKQEHEQQVQQQQQQLHTWQAPRSLEKTNAQSEHIEPCAYLLREGAARAALYSVMLALAVHKGVRC